MRKLLVCLLLCFVLSIASACVWGIDQPTDSQQTPSTSSYVIYDVKIDGSNKRVVENEKAPLPQLADTEEKIFVGWECNGETFNAETPVTSNLSITSVWRDRYEYSVTFDEVEVLVKEGQTVTLPEQPIKDGFVFVGWFNDNAEFDGTEPIYQSLTLVSKWIKAEEVYDYQAMTFTSLGSVGGSNAAKLEGGVSRDGRGIHFKFESEQDLAATDGISVFVSVGEVTNSSRTAASFLIQATVSGTIKVYNYPKNVKNLLVSGVGRLNNGILTDFQNESGKSALYITVPYAFFGGVDKDFEVGENDVIGLSLTAENTANGGYDVWTHEKLKGIDGNVVVNRLNPKDYVRISAKAELFDYPDNVVPKVDLVKGYSLWAVEGGSKINPVWTILAKRTSTEMQFLFITKSSLDPSVNNGVGMFLQLGERVSLERTDKTICIPMYTTGLSACSNYPNNKKTTITLEGVSVSVETDGNVTIINGVVPYAALSDYEIVTAEDDIGVSLTVDCGSSYEVWNHGTILGRDGTSEVNRGNSQDYLVWDKYGSLSEYDVTEADFNARVKSITGDTERVFFENMAEFSVDSTTSMQIIGNGTLMFTDRTNFTFDMRVASAIWGKKFTYSTITNGPKVTVTKAGYMLMVVADSSGYSKINTTVQNAGWKAILTKFNRTTISDPFTYYVKWCEVGETFSYGKWNFFVTV